MLNTQLPNGDACPPRFGFVLVLGPSPCFRLDSASLLARLINWPSPALLGGSQPKGARSLVSSILDGPHAEVRHGNSSIRPRTDPTSRRGQKRTARTCLIDSSTEGDDSRLRVTTRLIFSSCSAKYAGNPPSFATRRRAGPLIFPVASPRPHPLALFETVVSSTPFSADVRLIVGYVAVVARFWALRQYNNLPPPGMRRLSRPIEARKGKKMREKTSMRQPLEESLTVRSAIIVDASFVL